VYEALRALCRHTVYEALRVLGRHTVYDIIYFLTAVG
jgi:hypothetical protein